MSQRSSLVVLGVLTACIVLAVLTGGMPAAATTYVMMSDEDLADSSPVVVRARVLDKQPAPDGRPYTDYRLQVERVAKGRIAVDTQIVVSVLDAGAPGRPQLSLWGVPEFEPGEETLLFLDGSSAGTPGSWQVNHLALGAFRVLDIGGVQLALRALGEINEVEHPDAGDRPMSVQRAHHPRDLDRFMGWIKARDAGVDLPQDYFLEPAEGLARNAHDGYTTLSTASSYRVRWPDFDRGSILVWFIARNQPGLPDGGHRAFNQALNRWDDLANAIIDVWTPAPRNDSLVSGFSASDGNNTLLMNDPNHRIPDLVNCTGALAVGGPWHVDSEAAGWSHIKRGMMFRNIVEADIVSNNGIACWFRQSSKKWMHARQLYMHELGHTLGLGHSCGDSASGPCDTRSESNALMRASTSKTPSDVIRADDSRGVRFNDGLRYTRRGVGFIDR